MNQYLKEMIREVQGILEDANIYVFGKDFVKNVNHIDNIELLGEITNIKIILSEDEIMAFDREYAEGLLYRPDWDVMVENFKKCMEKYHCDWHMPDFGSINIDIR